MGSRFALLPSVVAHPQLRRLELAFAGFSLAEHATWIATLVYAFGTGGISRAGTVGFVLLSLATVTAPVAAFAGDRFRRDLVLAAGYGTQSAAMAATAVAMRTGASPYLVFTFAGISAALVTVARPAMGSLLPFVAESPGLLTAANVTMGIVENAGIFLGPMLASLLLAAWSPSVVFAVGSMVMAAGALSVLTIPGDRSRMAPPRGGAAADLTADILGGFNEIRRNTDVALLIAVLAMTAMIVGSLEVLFVAVAGTFDAQASAAGLLNSAFGIGAIVGATTSLSLVGRPRVSPLLLLGVGVLATPLVILGLYTTRLSALALFAVAGSGMSVVKVAGGILLQRVARAATAGRVFGALESVQMGAMAIGSIGVSEFVDAFGLGRALVTGGIVMSFTAVAAMRRLFRIDADAVAADPVIFARLRSDPIFAPLSAPSLERLALDTVVLETGPGDVVMAEGTRGDTYCVVESGRVDITIRSKPIRTIGEGGSFGELALLNGGIRTATATVVEPTRLLVIDRAAFLDALQEHGSARGKATAMAAFYQEPVWGGREPERTDDSDEA